MRLRTLGLALLPALLVLACKKESDEVLTVNSLVGAVIPNDANGALIATRSTMYKLNSSGWHDTTRYSYAAAWFENKIATKTTKLVRANMDTLKTQNIPSSGTNPSYTWYLTNTANQLNFFGSIGMMMNWRVDADSVNKIPEIIMADNRDFGELLLLTMPDSTTMAKGIKSTFRYLNPGTSATDQLLFMAKGSRGNIGWPLSLNTQTEVLSTTDLGRITQAGDSVIVTIMPVKLLMDEVEFKKYYFVKESPVSKVVRIQ